MNQKKNVNNEIPDFDSRVRHAWERWGKNSLKDEKKKNCLKYERKNSLKDETANKNSSFDKRRNSIKRKKKKKKKSIILSV